MESKTIESKKENESKIIEYPKKPKRGEVLKKTIDIICNLKQINFKETAKGKHIMTYDISFIPEINKENEKEKNLIKKKNFKTIKRRSFRNIRKIFLIWRHYFCLYKEIKR